MSTLATRDPMAVSSDTVAAPMPLAPPVTRATRSLRFTSSLCQFVLPAVGEHPEAVTGAAVVEVAAVVGDVVVPDGDGDTVGEVHVGLEALRLALAGEAHGFVDRVDACETPKGDPGGRGQLDLAGVAPGDGVDGAQPLVVADLSVVDGDLDGIGRGSEEEPRGEALGCDRRWQPVRERHQSVAVDDDGRLLLRLPHGVPP